MKKQNDFLTANSETRLNEKIKTTMQREFDVPESVNAAKDRAFDRIRGNQFKQDYANDVARKQKTSRRRKYAFFKGAAGFAAAAATFSVICIANPALAAQIPLVGHVFEELGSSLGFSGDFSKYAKSVDSQPVKPEESEGGAETEEETAKAENSSYSQTVDGVTVTLSEIYCNDAALYLSMIIETEEEFPATLRQNNTVPVISLQTAEITLDYASETLHGEYLDGKFIDDHTYAGVLRVDLGPTLTDMDDSYFEDRDAFFESLGVSKKEQTENTSEAMKRLKEIMGVDGPMTNEAIVAAGGPAQEDYIEQLTLPEEFTMELKIPQIIGDLPVNEMTTPQMPEDLQKEYDDAMAEQGLDADNYESFTEEEKEIEHRLYTEMWNQYEERFPEVAEYPNKYQNWWFDGEWDFQVDVTVDHSQTVVKEINDLDENGIGIVSVTRTPFEITVEDSSGSDYFTVVLDADGEIMENGTFGGYTNVLAIQDRDVSRLDIYICDYEEYMDELKGYYWSEDYEENKKTKTFKGLLDERAVHHTEVVF